MHSLFADIAAYHGNAYLKPTETLTPNTIAALGALALHLGMDAETIAAARPTDLITLYAVSKAKGETIGRKRTLAMVETIKARNPSQPLPMGAPQPQPLAAPAIDMEALKAEMRAMVAAEIAAQTPKEPLHLIVTGPTNPVPVPVGLAHERTPYVLRMLAAGENVYLYGPPGSGKTTMGKQCAEALGLDFYATAKIDSEYLLLGFATAVTDPLTGKVIIARTPFRDAWEFGGCFLFDEMDRSNPNAVAALNMALANKVCPFPDGLVPMHPNFRLIGAGNTNLGGPTMSASAAVKMEGPTIDRFYFIPFGYDETLEMAIAPNPDWTRYVQAVRAAVKARAIDFDVTPRASISGGNVLANGATWEEAEEGALFKGLDPETVAQIKRDIRAPAALSIAA